MLANFNCYNNVCQLNPLPLKYIWNDSSAVEFQSAFQTTGIRSKISSFMNSSILDTQEAAGQLNLIITEAADISLKAYDKGKKNKHKPKSKTGKKQKQWFDSDLKSMRKRVIANGKLYSMFPSDPIVRGRYYRLYRLYNKAKKVKERQFKKQLLEQIEDLHSDNPKEYWNLIDMLKDENSNNFPAENIKPEEWISHFESLGKLDDKFKDRATQLHYQVQELERQPVYNNLDNPIKLDEIYKAINKLKNNKAVGLDSVSNEMLKAAQNSIGSCLLKLFNACLSGGQYPTHWSGGYITPLHKSDDPCDPSNYRGISIMSAVGKVFNTVLNNRLDTFLFENCIINKCQIGFTKEARTSDHMFILKTLIDKYCSKAGGKLYACFVDFRKAFDSVIHDGLKYKLLQLGIGTKFYNIIKSMYTNSQSCLRLGNGLTNPFKLGIGVRQGDVLSPNLFKIFINDLPEYLQSSHDPVQLHNLNLHCLMYADDVIILSESASGLQEKLKILENYCSDWCLKVNVNKTKVITFNKAGRLIKSSFIFQNNDIECVSSYRYLGLFFSASGSFSYAKSELYKKGLKAYFKLCKNILSLHPSLKTSLHIFDHTIKPVLLYGSEIWGIFNPASAKFRNGISLNKIFNNIEPDKLHIKFAKFILGVNRKSTNFAVMSELGRFPFYLDIVKAVLKYWYRLEHFDQTSLLFNALECSKEIDRTHNSWYSTVRQFSNLLDLPLTSSVNMRQSTFNSQLSKVLKEKCLSEWHSIRQTYTVGKLDSYTKIKYNFGFEKYLSTLSFPYRRDLTRLRISSHRLSIEAGRYARIDRSDRLCTKCTMGVLGDEMHFLVDCPAYNTERVPFFSLVGEKCKNFMLMNNSDKFFWLLNCENEMVMQRLSSFVHSNLDK